MLPFRLASTPARLAGFSLHRGPSAFVQDALGQVGVVDRRARANLIKITTGVAMGAGGVYALMNVPGATKVSQVSLGLLGGALLLTGLLKIYDGVD